VHPVRVRFMSRNRGDGGKQWTSWPLEQVATDVFRAHIHCVLQTAAPPKPREERTMSSSMERRASCSGAGSRISGRTAHPRIWSLRRCALQILHEHGGSIKHHRADELTS